MQTGGVSNTQIAVREIAIPDGPGAEGWEDFVAATALGNEVQEQLFGTRDLTYPPEVDLAEYQLQEEEPRRLFVAERGGRMVGLGRIEWTLEEGDDAVWVSILVPPAERGHGVARALMRRLVELTRETGRAVMQTWTANVHPVAGDVLVPVSGAGAVDAAAPGPRALLADGWSLEQVERVSRIRLPMSAEDIARRRTPADAYEVVSWTGPTPAAWETDIALLHSAISVDAPSAGLSIAAEDWSLEHLRARDRMHNTAGRRELTVAAVHRSSGRLAGYSSLDLFDDATRPALQNDTIVLTEHRGHRLGMLLKLANIEILQNVAPDCGAIYTWNAEENRAMLAVNEDVGFVAVAVEGLWKTVLA